MCGENRGGLPTPGRRAGSSPRVRGKRADRERLEALAGLIPACAGKTLTSTCLTSSLRAHPRVCGENPLLFIESFQHTGSSPRVRGKRRSSRPPRGLDGLIPACAGKTWLAGKKRHEKGAHPRVCGENYMNRLTDVQDTGSSPRVRGKRRQTRPSVRRVRLIPACAGKTWTSYLVICLAPAHPRVCGENSAGKASVSLREGSSPRVRGKPACTSSCERSGGLIPACAGKTPSQLVSSSQLTAHPRVCGENTSDASSRTCAMGSSPRVRGKRGPPFVKVGRSGLIPACAGKTGSSARMILLLAAHPRVCGENSTVVIALCIGWGSSPRVRGKRFRR